MSNNKIYNKFIIRFIISNNKIYNYNNKFIIIYL